MEAVTTYYSRDAIHMGGNITWRQLLLTSRDAIHMGGNIALPRLPKTLLGPKAYECLIHSFLENISRNLTK